jgi:hypothetical protein
MPAGSPPGGGFQRLLQEADMNRSLIAVAAVLLASGCAHDAEGHRLRSTSVRFDERSISGPGFVYTLEDDGAWAGSNGDRYRLDGDEIRKVGAGFDKTGYLIRPAGWVDVERRPDGLVYTPSWPTSIMWTFVTEDVQPIPRDLEAPLYLTSRIGLEGAIVDFRSPGSEQAGIELKPDCGVVLFDLKGRQVAGWAVRKGSVCPEPRYPGKDALARIIAVRNEVWQSPYRAGIQ